MSREAPLRVVFRDAQEFAREFDENLSKQGLFIPTQDLRPVRSMVEFVVVVPSSKEEIAGRGEVIYTVDLDDAGERKVRPGLGVQVLEFDMEAARQARAEAQQRLTEAALKPPEQRQAIRVPARLRVRFRTRAEFEAGLTRDISTGGIYLLTEEPFPVGTAIHLMLERPLDGRELELAAEVARTALISEQKGPSVGMGVRFRDLDAESKSGVDHFVRYVDLRHRVGKARTLRGRVDDTGVESVVHVLCDAQREGELVLRRGTDAGRIEVKGKQIVRAELPTRGLSGERAFFRLLTWEDGDFEYLSRSVDPAGGMNSPGAKLVLRGLEFRSDIEKWSRRIPPTNRLVPGPTFARAGAVLPASARKLLDLIEQRPTVQYALDRMGRSDLEAYRLLAKLFNKGVVRFE